MEKNQFETRKQVVYDLICDPKYKPMKQKELAIFLQVPRERRQDLVDVLDALAEHAEAYFNLAPIEAADHPFSLSLPDRSASASAASRG